MERPILTDALIDGLKAGKVIHSARPDRCPLQPAARITFAAAAVGIDVHQDGRRVAQPEMTERLEFWHTKRGLASQSPPFSRGSAVEAGTESGPRLNCGDELLYAQAGWPRLSPGGSRAYRAQDDDGAVARRDGTPRAVPEPTKARQRGVPGRRQAPTPDPRKRVGGYAGTGTKPGE